MEVTANKMDYSTAEALLGKLGAETTAARSVTARNWAISGGIVGGVVMLGAAAMIFAWGQRGPSPEELAKALEQMPTLKVEPLRLDPNANNVELADGAEVTLKDGGEVTLKEGATVALEEGATVELDGSNFKMPSLPKVADQLGKDGGRRQDPPRGHRVLAMSTMAARVRRSSPAGTSRTAPASSRSANIATSRSRTGTAPRDGSRSVSTAGGCRPVRRFLAALRSAYGGGKERRKRCFARARREIENVPENIITPVCIDNVGGARPAA